MPRGDELEGLAAPPRLHFGFVEVSRMTTAETARRLLMDAAGEALCDSCLAFACSVSLTEMREVSEQLLNTPSFQRGDRCTSCRRTVPTIMYSAKCSHCSRAVVPGADALVIRGDILHATCFNLLVSDKNRRISRKLHEESRRLIEEARRVLDAGRSSPRSTSG